jgi:hypothetical protein
MDRREPSQIESGSSIGAADRRGKSVLGFLKLETASIYGQRRRANLEDVALKLPGFFKT